MSNILEEYEVKGSIAIRDKGLYQKYKNIAINKNIAIIYKLNGKCGECN